jgi:hypothetical protein
MVADILEKRTVSIVRYAFYTSNMAAVRSYVMSADICQNVRRYIPKISNLQFVGSEVLRAVVMKDTIFWNITPCSPLKVNRRFEGIYRNAKSKCEAGSKQSYLLPASCWFLAWLILLS